MISTTLVLALLGLAVAVGLGAPEWLLGSVLVAVLLYSLIVAGGPWP